MTNGSNSTPIDYQSLALGCLGYAVEGSVIGVTNLLVVFSILRYQALRDSKQYIIILALALADAMNCFAFFAAGSYRLAKVLGRQVTVMVRPIDCLTAPHLWLLVYFEPLAPFMLTIVSFDRLFQVYNPLYYIGLGRAYALRMMAASYTLGFSLATLGILLMITGRKTYTESALCYVYGGLFGSESFLQESYNYYYNNGPAAFALASVVLYLLIWPVYKRKTASIAPTTSAEQKAELKRQNKLTKSLAISCGCTFMLYCLPVRLAFLALERDYKVLAQCFFMMGPMNSLANMIIYQYRHEEMRIALKGLFVKKELPGNLNLWPKKTPHVSEAIPMGSGSNKHIAPRPARVEHF